MKTCTNRSGLEPARLLLLSRKEERRDRLRSRRFCWSVRSDLRLEQVPEGLVVDLVVELHFGSLDEGAEVASAAVGGSLLEIGETALHIGAEDFGNPLRRLEVVDCGLDVIG